MGVHRFAPLGHALTYAEYYRSVAVWSLGEGQACRARWTDARLRRKFLARYGTARHLLQDLQLLGVLVLLLANLFAAVAGGPLAALAVGLDGGVLAGLALWWRARRWTWRRGVYELQGIVYGPWRQLLFGVGLLSQPPPPETYPKDVELVRGRDAEGTGTSPRV